jgi:hypothetical protein
MKAIFSMTIFALFSTLLAGCWFYTRPDETTAGCQKTTYGLAVATTSTENCPPPAADTAPPPSLAPPLPPPATP